MAGNDTNTSQLRVDPSASDYARSHTENWVPPIPISSEQEALQSLKKVWKHHSRDMPECDAYKSKRPLLLIDLCDFEVYRSPNSGFKGRQSELISLHYLEVPMPKKLWFDGFISVGNVKHYVQGIHIQDSSIEGYGDSEDPQVVVYLQSELASKDVTFDVWYRLNRPTVTYQRFHGPFLWVAQLGKHIIDYLESQPARTVGLACFQTDFHSWLMIRYHKCPEFEQWHHAFRDQIDFRVGVNAYIDYFYHQAYNLANAKHLLAHPLWGDCMVRGLVSVKPQPRIEELTIATPNVFESFKDMYFGKNLQEQRPSKHVQASQELRKGRLGFSKAATAPSAPPTLCQPYYGAPIQVGDVVAMHPDDSDQKLWRGANWEWLAYVHGIKLLNNGNQRLFVLWLYRPRETNIFKAKYPLDNELFLSDNCNCTEGEFLSTDVLGKYNVHWSPGTLPATDLFVRQVYITQDSAFVTLKEKHKVCSCSCKKDLATCASSYCRGDTVYIAKTAQDREILEPAIIWSIDASTANVTLRTLRRLGRDFKDLTLKADRSNIAANELVLTDEFETITASQIQRKCNIRFVPKHDLLNHQIPTAYDHGGAGDLWIISMGVAVIDGVQQLVYLSKLPECFQEGIDISAPGLKLRGLSIFSGGGSLDRGLEEGGAVEFETVVDFSSAACHTQRANAKDPSKMRIFCGSVDDFLKRALHGTDPKLIPRVSEVEFIAAGSPCPGFSTLQQNFLSEASLRNASHVSTFCSCVDLFRPEYGLLENVVNMASTRLGFEDENVLSQVVACLVSMGYQVRQYIMDAWSYGSVQRRSRLFLSIAAPGLTPLVQPWHSHSRPFEDTAGRSLGKLPNGERFGEREHYPTPFTYTSAGYITADLPNISNGNVQTCVSYPDHRVLLVPTRDERALLKYIPKSPPGSGYTSAMQLGLIPPMLQRKKKETEKSYTRIKEAGLVPCITTTIRISDSHNGATLHWSQDRAISILEARRTQGYPDHEPIIGSLKEQFAIVGNGVDRHVSFVQGLTLRQVLERNAASNTAYSGITDGREDAETLFDSDEDCRFTDAEETVELSGSAEDDGYLTDASASVIYFQALAHKSQYRKPQTPSVVIPIRSRREQSLAKLTEQPEQANTTSIHTLDGTSETPRQVSEDTTSLLSRLSQTVTRGVERLSLSLSSSTRPTSTALSTPEKRRRDDDSSESDGSHIVICTQNSIPRKRAKTTGGTHTSSATASSSEGHPHQSSIRRHTTSLKKSRPSRHSSLAVEFAPTRWNTKPESERH